MSQLLWIRQAGTERLRDLLRVTQVVNETTEQRYKPKLQGALHWPLKRHGSEQEDVDTEAIGWGVLSVTCPSPSLNYAS